MRTPHFESETDVLNYFGIDNFRQLKKEHIMQFTSLIPTMDKELAEKCIEQFPEFKAFGNDILSKLTDSYNNIIEHGKDSAKEAMQAYGLILNSLKEMLEKDELTFEEKRIVASDMVAIADKIAELDKDWKHFLGQFAAVIGGVAMGLVVLGATLLGVKVDTDRLIR